MKNKQRHVIALLTIGLAIPAAFGRSAKIAKDLDTTKTTSVDVIVQFGVPRTSKQDTLVTQTGGRLKTALSAASKAGVYTMPLSALEGLATSADVKYITPNRAVQGNDVYTNEASNATAAQSYGWSGAGVGVAIIDSGASAVLDFDSRIVYSQTFVTERADEVYGHGTHVSGIVAGNGSTYKGIAPGANIISLRVLDDLGSGTDSNVIAAIDRAIALKSTYNIRVMNLSLG